MSDKLEATYGPGRTTPPLEARIAAVLAEHTLHMLTMATDDQNGEWVVECNCDIPPISADGFFDGEQKFAAHQAAMLAPVIAEAQAEAFDDGVTETFHQTGSTLSDEVLDAAKYANFYRSNDE